MPGCTFVDKPIFSSEDFTTAKPCLANDTLHGLTLIRTALIPEEHSAWFDLQAIC